MLTARSECLDHVNPLGEGHLRRVLREYVEHYNTGRHRQGIGGKRIAANHDAEPVTDGEVKCRLRLGGMLNLYHRDAA